MGARRLGRPRRQLRARVRRRPRPGSVARRVVGGRRRPPARRARPHRRARAVEPVDRGADRRRRTRRVYAHEIVSLAPGQAGEYLNAVAHEGADVYAEYGFSVVGAFSTAMRTDNEAILIWAIPDFAAWADFEQGATADQRAARLEGHHQRVRRRSWSAR